jgi:hypothetical protein
MPGVWRPFWGLVMKFWVISYNLEVKKWLPSNSFSNNNKTIYIIFIVENSDGLLYQVPPHPFPHVPQDNELENPFDSKSPL